MRRMKILNYLNLNQHPVYLSFERDRTREFREIYHAHQGMELLFVHEGEGTAVVGQQIIRISPGTLLYFRPFQLHRLRLAPADRPRYVRSLFVFEPSVVDAALAAFPSLRSYLRSMTDGTLVPQGFSIGDPDQVLALIRMHLPRLRQSDPARLLEEQLLFLTAFLHHASSHTPERPGADKESAGVRTHSVAERVMVWIEDHYAEAFDLKRLADDIHLSPNHISAAFRKAVGSSITEYLAARRIRQACWLLRTSDLSIREIGESVGLPNDSYFCQWFRKQVGMTPRAFRRSADWKPDPNR
ncbi:helix-turn-helix domain-containing protein [Paenibacillus thermoaerophilus]|nr:helix-turn-helix domain-containing protein [Paenibacillus thermoaerophilus]